MNKLKDEQIERLEKALQEMYKDTPKYLSKHEASIALNIKKNNALYYKKLKKGK